MLSYVFLPKLVTGGLDPWGPGKALCLHHRDGQPGCCTAFMIQQLQPRTGG